MGPNADMSGQRLAELDSRLIWHPFTPMRQWIADAGEPGRIIREAEGFELIDAHGRRFIDGFSSLWCNLHGHRVEKIDRAITDQLSRAAHSTLLGHASPPSIELAERLVAITPGDLTKVFYSDSGATAVEIALKMAFQYFRNTGQGGRGKFIALRQGYHGDTIGAMSVGGIEAFHSIFRPLLFESTFVDTPNAYHHPAGDRAGQVVLEQVEDILRGSGEAYCAIIAEPLIQAAGGMLTHPPGFLTGLRRLTRQYGLLLIADEVATGFARTGKLFACNHEQVCPDLMCLGKGLTGGYLPVAATLATEAVFEGFCGEVSEGRTFYHGHTYTGNALGCAAAVAGIDLIFETGLLEALGRKVETIRARLTELQGHPNVGDIRQCGMMVGIELVADRDKREAFGSDKRVGQGVCKHARKHDIIIRPLGDVVVLMPAPAMDNKTLERLMTGVIATIREFFE